MFAILLNIMYSSWLAWLFVVAVGGLLIWVMRDPRIVRRRG